MKTMKKYIQPATDVIAISAEQQLLAGANSVNGVDGLDGVDVEKTGTFRGGAVDSRGSSSWDDDDDF